MIYMFDGLWNFLVLWFLTDDPPEEDEDKNEDDQDEDKDKD